MHRMSPIIVLLWLGLISQNAQGQSGPSTNTPTQDLAAFVEEERELLAPFHLIPIIVPRGERVGDNFDRETSTLIAGVDDCFPRLKVRKEPGQLPSITTFSERGLAAALGAAGVVNVEGGGAAKRVYVLSFRDVEVQTASVAQLRNAMARRSAQECEAVRPYLQALSSSKKRAASELTEVPGVKIPPRRVASIASETKPVSTPVLIGTVYYARRVLRVALSGALDAQAKASWGQSFLQTLGLDSSFKVSAAGGLVTSNAVEFVGDAIIPVAYAPAFEVTGTTFAQGGRTTVQIAEIKSDEIRANVVIMEALLRFNKLVASGVHERMRSHRGEVAERGFVLGAPELWL